MRQIALAVVVILALVFILSRMTTEMVGTVTKVDEDKITVYSDRGHLEELTNTWGDHAWSNWWVKPQLAAKQIRESIKVGESYVFKIPLLRTFSREVLAVWRPGWKNWR